MIREDILKDLKENCYIDTNVDTRLVDVTIKYVLDTIIYPLDPEFTNENPDYVDIYLPAIAWYVNAELVIPLSYKTKNAGVIRNVGEGYTQSAESEVRNLREHYLSKAEIYLNRLKRHLNKHQKVNNTPHFPINL